MEKNTPEWHLIQETKSLDIDKLFDVYRKDPKKARVLFFNDSSKYTSSRLVLFKRERGDFEIVWFRKKVGISKTNRIYSRESKVQSVIYKNGKFYYSVNSGSKRLTQLTWNGLQNFVSNFSSWNESKNHAVIKSFFKKFSWIRFVSEQPVLYNVSFNTITRYKLYNTNDALKHILKAPLPVVKNVMLMFKDYAPHDMVKIWKEMKDVLINVENLKPELFSHHLFIDTCKMARTLDKKVNCSWGEKRLRLEHDNWSKEITNTVLEFEEERQLNVANIYIKFAEFSGYKLLKTNKDLLREGMTQKHCVGTYINKVDNGNAGIFHIDGYTLELCFERISDFMVTSNWRATSDHIMTNNKYLKIYQFRGYRNCSAPETLEKNLNDMVTNFNLRLAKDVYKDLSDINYLNKADKNEIKNNPITLNDLNLNLDLIDINNLF